MEYVVKSGESLWSIADKYLGSGLKYTDLIKLNNLSKDAVIYPGQKLIISQDKPQEYKELDTHSVVQGETLSSIANKYGTTVQDLVVTNKLKDPNTILVGQKLKVPKPLKYQPQIRDFSQIKEIEKGINSKSDLDIINYYHRNNADDQYYLVDDKLNNRLSVYLNGNLVKSYNAIHGKNKHLDDMTVTYVDEKGNIKNLAGNLSTPAGVYFTTRGGDYHGAPSFLRRTKEQVQSNNPRGIPSSIHARTIYEGANTNGCTGLSCTDLKDLEKYIQTPNIKTYILPSDSRNRFFLRNGELQFKSHDISKTPSYNTIVTKPIEKIKWGTDNLSDTNIDIIKSFATSLITNKSSLQKDLGINNDSYNELALYALGILGVESGYGNENSGVGNFIRAARKALFKNNSSPDYKSKYYTYGIQGDNNSIGLTQIRFKYLSDREKKLFEKYGITKQSLVDSPEKAAIATMIKLGQSFLDSGNIEAAVKRWNNKPSYFQQVSQNRQRFKLYEKYFQGGKLIPRSKFISKLHNNFND